jgi:hypothetical protein
VPQTHQAPGEPENPEMPKCVEFFDKTTAELAK